MTEPGVRLRRGAKPPFPKQQFLYITGALFILGAGSLIARPSLVRAVLSPQYLPHLYCYLSNPLLIWTHVVADGLIGVSYACISATLAYLIYKGRSEIPFQWIFLAFGLFIVACSATHFFEIVTVWIPLYVLSAGVKVITAVVSLVTAAVLPFTVPHVLALVHEARSAEEHRQRLEPALAERDVAQRGLWEMNGELEQRVLARTAELAEANRALEAGIRQREQVEERLAELAAIVEFSDDAIIGKTLEGVVKSWNGGAQRIFGYAAEEIVGKPISLLVPPDRTDEEPEILARISEGESVRHYETVRVTKARELINLSLTVSPIRNAHGRVIAASAISRDITARKRAEAALLESESQYRLLFDRSPLPTWVFDRKTLAFLQVNEAAIRHYGYSRQEFLAMTILDIRPETGVSGPRETISNLGQGIGSSQIWKHKKKDGSIIDVEIAGHDLRFHETEAQLIVAHDVTERQRSEVSLRQSEERFSKVFRSSPLAITITTPSRDEYLDVNDAFLAMMKYQRSEVIGRTSTELNMFADPGSQAAMIQLLHQLKRVPSFETHFETNQGESRLVQVAAELVHLNGTPCVLSIIHDITEERRLEDQFRQAQKMEAVGRLAGGVAHDFNNMLGVILGYSEIAQELLEHENPLRKHLQQISKTAHRAASLTRQLLAFSRRQDLQPTVLDLNAVVTNLSKMLVRMIGEDIELKFIPGEALGAVRADLGEMEQVLMNLVINARDAMPEGGTILVDTANTSLDGSYRKEHPAVVPGAYVMLAVSDTGCGIDQKTMGRIFEPFFTTKAVGEGTGLGLSMVYGVVKQSGGYIWAYSEPNRGATFKIYLPRVDEPAEPLLRFAEDATLEKGSETILLVEDDDSLRELAAGLLRSEGYQVLEGRDGATAMAAAQKHGELIHLLLTDVIMPGMSGAELSNRVRAIRPGIKLLFMSGYTGNLIAHHGVLASDTVLLQKPFTRHSLLRQVRTTLDRIE
jgi:PAS domain S-box-containing protein